MPTDLDIRSIESPTAAEIYISATPGQTETLQEQAGSLFSAIAETLRLKRAQILHERVFTTQPAMQALLRQRTEAYGDIDDGVSPSFLVGRKGMSGPVAGVQVHAVVSDTKAEVIRLDETACGRILRTAEHTCLTLSGIGAPQFSTATEQARAIMEKAESALQNFGADFLSVARTWIWLGDILSWYGDFNEVRNKFFSERGLIGADGRQSIPASTGIGLAPADSTLSCSMDLTAVLKPQDSIRYLPAVGRQQCALEYGSAFSRASQATTPAGRTVFVSGTASIDADGATTNIGDAAGQINSTIENVRAVLRDMNTADEDVVQVVAYCKTTEVEETFNALKDNLPWPWVTINCDICRPDLLFEIEAAAMPKQSV